MNTIRVCALMALGLLIGGCGRAPQSGRGFYLPPGNAERGRVAFVDLKCNSCHAVAGVDLPKPTSTISPIVVLGGEVSRVRSYGDLVTSIIYPSHNLSDLLSPAARQRLATSPMPPLNVVMRVEQLVDVVAFLEPHYFLRQPSRYETAYTP
jgi:L-cysteine S-thiosulfotransferase